MDRTRIPRIIITLIFKGKRPMERPRTKRFGRVPEYLKNRVKRLQEIGKEDSLKERL